MHLIWSLQSSGTFDGFPRQNPGIWNSTVSLVPATFLCHNSCATADGGWLTWTETCGCNSSALTLASAFTLATHLTVYKIRQQMGDNVFIVIFQEHRKGLINLTVFLPLCLQEDWREKCIEGVSVWKSTLKGGMFQKATVDPGRCST